MKRKIIISAIILTISIIINIFIYNDDYMYKTSIMKITNISTIKEDTNYNALGIEEKIYLRKIEGIITNGKDRGKKIEVKYEESYSSIVTDKYRIGDKVFIKNHNIDGLKRDFYLSLLITIFITLMFIVGEFKGLLSVLSVLLNVSIFYIGLLLYFKGINLLFICMLEGVIFSVVSLFISGGINNKTKSAIISTLVSTSVLVLVSYIILKITKYKGINFNDLKFLTVPPEDLIVPEILMGALGAIMDVSITMSSSISELIEKNKKIRKKELVKSSKEIGKDIMSTMTNVLFFTYLCGGLPFFILAFRNGYSIYHYVTNNLSLELTRFLTGSIGIIMTIPIATFICIKIFKRGEINE